MNKKREKRGQKSSLSSFQEKIWLTKCLPEEDNYVPAGTLYGSLREGAVTAGY
jgi:hypothetical protein